MDANAETPALMETSHSMPSLDAIDETSLPVDAITDAVDDVVPTEVEATLTTESSATGSLTSTATYIPTDASLITSSLTTTETSTSALTTTTTTDVTPETSVNSEIASETEALILNSEDLQTHPSELPEELPEEDEDLEPQAEEELSEPQLPQNDSLDDNTDDPSEAIDQFIKKIADEQLSSKRTLAKDLAEDNIEKENIEQPGVDKNSEEPSEMKEPGVEEPEPVAKPQPEPEPEPESEEPLLPLQLREELLTTQVMPPNEYTDNLFSEDVEKSQTVPEQKKRVYGKATAKTDKENKTKNQQMDDRERLLAILKDPEPEEPEAYLENISAPADVSKDPELIKEAQTEINRVDVLVCGNCHEVFHFVEDFQGHKTRRCVKRVDVASQCKNESKPQVWGFTLWKAKHTMTKKKADSTPSSWSIYQRWCKLSQVDKDAWITAGQTLQFCAKIATAQVIEFKPRATTTQMVLDTKDNVIDLVDSNKENNERNPTAVDLLKRGIIKPVKLNNDVTILPSIKSTPVVELNSNKAIRTTKVMSTQKQEYAVEKIVAKRFNPRRKIWEYQIKWENFPSDANTWEPVTNLNHCKQMLDQFEEQLKKFKEEKAKQATLGLARGRERPKSPNNFGQRTLSGSSQSSTPGRPTRSCKQKALDQVKAWCGTMSDEENSGGVKRPREDDESDDSYEKKIKYEEDSDYSEEEEKPKFTIRKTPQKKIVSASPAKSDQIVKNGVSSPAPQPILPANILVPDANGVVRINQKQLPSLSTGVYIMSKTAGIIKLDSTTSKVATSGGQTIVKVAPKIGQTQIKIVKKEGGVTKQIIHMSPQKVSPIKAKVPMISSVTSMAPTPPKVNNVARTIVKPAPPKIKKQEIKVVQRPREEPPKAPTPPPEDSDDGLEPLDFPTDLPLPEPESPPAEFTLDPSTGKVAGRDYPEEKEVVIMPEPGTIKREMQEMDHDPLENIVKLAAADITEEDLKSEMDPLAVSSEESNSLPSPPKSMFKSGTANIMTKVLGGTKTTPKAEPPSLLNKALTGSTILQRSLTGQKVGRPQQRILNHSVGQQQQKAYIMQNVPTRSTPGLNRLPRPAAPRPSPKARFNISPQPIIARVQPRATAASMNSRMQVFSGRSTGQQQPRRVGNTIIRSAPQPAQRSPPKMVQTVYKVSPKKEGVWMQAQQQPPRQQMVKRRVISMPSLFGEDESPGASPQLKKIQKPSAPKPTPKPITRVVPKAPRQPDFSAMMEPEVVAPPPPVNAEVQEVPAQAAAEAAETNVTDLSSFTLADSENPIFITGDDGTVYQVAGQNEQGQTILITQGADGQQQCLLVTNEIGDSPIEDPTEEENVTAAETAEAAAPMEIEPQSEEEEQAETQQPEEVADDLKEPLQIKTDFEATESGVEASDQVVAQVVRAEPPSPGGTHKVVVMLPDGNLMVTQVSPEEYASLELE